MGALLTFFLSGGKGSKIAYIAIAILFAGLSLFIGTKLLEVHNLHSDIDKLTKANQQLTIDYGILEKNNAVLKQNQNTLATSNATNYDTVKKLDDERKAAKAAVASLAAGNKIDKAALDALQHRINLMAKDPSNDGPVAPVLKETIRQIQSNRDSK